jgi:hypothetical protein
MSGEFEMEYDMSPARERREFCNRSMECRQFNIRSIFVTTFVVALMCAVCRLYLSGFEREATGAAWLFAMLTFLAGMFSIAFGAVLSAFRENSSGKAVVRFGRTLVVSAAPAGVVLAITFLVIDIFVRR